MTVWPPVSQARRRYQQHSHQVLDMIDPEWRIHEAERTAMTQRHFRHRCPSRSRPTFPHRPSAKYRGRFSGSRQYCSAFRVVTAAITQSVAASRIDDGPRAIVRQAMTVSGLTPTIKRWPTVMSVLAGRRHRLAADPPLNPPQESASPPATSSEFSFDSTARTHLVVPGNAAPATDA